MEADGVGLLRGALLRCVSGQQGGAVARVLHGLDQGGGAEQAGDALDGGALGGEVDLGPVDSRDTGERAFHAAGTGGAGHAGDRQLAAIGADVVAGGLDGGGQLVWCGLVRVEAQVGLFVGQVHRGGDTRQGVQRGFHAAGTGGAGHAHDWQADMLASVLRRGLGRCGRGGGQRVHRGCALRGHELRAIAGLAHGGEQRVGGGIRRDMTAEPVSRVTWTSAAPGTRDSTRVTALAQPAQVMPDTARRWVAEAWTPAVILAGSPGSAVRCRRWGLPPLEGQGEGARCLLPLCPFLEGALTARLG